jgi:hypothetical protein
VSLAESNPADCDSKHKRLPHDLLGSVESLAADRILHELLGDKLVAVVIAMRKVISILSSVLFPPSIHIVNLTS